MDRQEIKLLIGLVLSRALVFLGTYFLVVVLFAPELTVTQWLNKFSSQWDAGHYLAIADHGYVASGEEATFIVFPPLYPWILRGVNLGVRNMAVTGLVTANVFFLIGGLSLYKLLKLDFPQKLAARAVKIAALFPTAYFWSSVYPEPLFLTLFCLTFLMLRKGKLGWAGIAAGLLTLTKQFGILIWPAMLVEWWVMPKRKITTLGYWGATMLVAVMIYLGLNYKVHGDVLAFSKFLQTNWQKSVAFPWKGIVASFRTGLMMPTWGEYRILVGWAEAVTATIAWLLIPISLWGKLKLRASYGVYYVLGVILFTATGFILSGPRYLLSLPPFFVVWAKIWGGKIREKVWLGLSTAAMLYLAYLFSLGHWAF